jgi:hypothetical protein
MAKKPEPLTLADLNIGLSSSKLGMSSAIADQLKAAMEEGVSNAEPQKSNASLDDKSIDKLNANIIILAGAIERNTKVLQKRSESKSNSSLSSNDLSENQIEAQRVQDYQTRLLEKIEENTRGGGGGGGKDDTPNVGEDIGIVKIGLFATLIAGALATIAGVLTAYAKVIVKTFVGTGLLIINTLKKTGELLLKLIPDSVKALVFKMINSISIMIDILVINVQHAIGTLIELFKNRFPKAFTFVTDAIESVKAFSQKAITVAKNVMQSIVTFAEKTMDFAKSAISKIANVFISAKDAIVNFFKPIVTAFGEIKSASSTVGNIVSKISKGVTEVGSFFAKIVGWMGSFASVFKAFFVIGQKLALPVTIIMGLFEGISDAIDEFKKTGDILATAGSFIKGFLHSAVGSILDIFKNAISWIIGALGFDQVEEMLDSFSFNDIISELVDHMINGINILINWAKSIFSSLNPFSDSVPTGEKETAPKQKAPMTNISQQQNTESHVEKQPDGKLKYMVNGKEVDSKTYQDNYNKNNVEMGNTVPLSVAPSKQSKYADQMYGKSAAVAAGDKAQPQQKQSTVISAPTQVNNSTQNTSFKSPVRNTDNTVNSYLKSRYVA